MLLSWRVFFKIVMFLLKNMLIYDKPLLSDQPPLSKHLLILRGWPLYGCPTLERNKKHYRLYRRNNSQHLLAPKCWESLDCVGGDVQTDATTPDGGGTYSASRDGYDR